MAMRMRPSIMLHVPFPTTRAAPEASEYCSAREQDHRDRGLGLMVERHRQRGVVALELT